MKHRKSAGMGLVCAAMVWLVLVSCSSHRDTTPRKAPAAPVPPAAAAVPQSKEVPQSHGVSANMATRPQPAGQSPEEFFRELKIRLISEGFEILANEPLEILISRKDIYKTHIMLKNMKGIPIIIISSGSPMKAGLTCKDAQVRRKMAYAEEKIGETYGLKDVLGISCVEVNGRNIVVVFMGLEYTARLRRKFLDVIMLQTTLVNEAIFRFGLKSLFR